MLLLQSIVIPMFGHYDYYLSVSFDDDDDDDVDYVVPLYLHSIHLNLDRFFHSMHLGYSSICTIGSLFENIDWTST